jgi:hypothetical protein
MNARFRAFENPIGSNSPIIGPVHGFAFLASFAMNFSGLNAAGAVRDFFVFAIKEGQPVARWAPRRSPSTSGNATTGTLFTTEAGGRLDERKLELRR